MDPPAESPLSRAQRMFWTVWGYISDAVERVLRPTNTGNNETNSDQACSTDREIYDCSSTQHTAEEGGQNEKQPTPTASSEVKLPQTVVAMEQCKTPIGQGRGTANVQCSVQHIRGSNSQAEDEKNVTLDEVDLSESKDIVLHVTKRQLASEGDANKKNHGELCGKEWNHTKKADKNEKIEQSTSEKCLVKNIQVSEIEVVVADDLIRLGVHGKGRVKSKEILEDSLWMQPNDDQHESEAPWIFTEKLVDWCGEENITHGASYLGETSDEYGELERKTSVLVAAIDGGSPLTYNKESIALSEELTVVEEEKTFKNIDKNKYNNVFMREAIEIEVHGAENTLRQLDEETELKASRGEESDFKTYTHIRREPETNFNEISVITEENQIQEVEVSANDKQTADNIGEGFIMIMEDVQNCPRLEGTGNFEDSSSGTCERLSGLENIVCEQTLQPLPDNNNGKWQYEDVTQRVFEIGDNEPVTTQVQKEVKRVEADYINSNLEAEHLSLKDLMEVQPDSEQKDIDVSCFHNYMDNNLEMVKEGPIEFLSGTEKPFTIAQEPGCSLVPERELEMEPMQTEVIQFIQELDNEAKNKTQNADFELFEQTEESTKTLRLHGESVEVCGPKIKPSTMFENGSVGKTDKNKSAQRRDEKEFSEDTDSLETNYHKMTEAFSYNESLGAEDSLETNYDKMTEAFPYNESLGAEDSLETNYHKMTEAFPYNESLGTELQNMGTDLAIVGTGPESIQVMIEKDVKTKESKGIERGHLLSETVEYYHTEILNVVTKTATEMLIELSEERIETEYTLKADVHVESAETEEAVSNKLCETDIEQEIIESQLSDRSMNRERDTTALVLVKTVSDNRGETEVKIIEKSAAIEHVIETNAEHTDAEILDVWIEAIFSKDTDHTFKGESKEIDEAPDLLGKPICELRRSTETDDNSAFTETTRSTMTEIEQKDMEAALLSESETGLWINPQTDIEYILSDETETEFSETSSDKFANVDGALLTGIRLCVDTHETEQATLEKAETNKTAVLRQESPELFETKVFLKEEKVIEGPLVIDNAVPKIIDIDKTEDPVKSIVPNSQLLEDWDNDLTETKIQTVEVGFSEAVRQVTELLTETDVLDVNSEWTWHQPLEENVLVEAVGIKAEFLANPQRCFRKDSIEIRCEPAAETVPSTQDENQQIFSGLHIEKEAEVAQESRGSEVLLVERVVTPTSFVGSDFEKLQEGCSDDIEKMNTISSQDDVAKVQLDLQTKTILRDTDPHLQFRFKAYPLDFTAQKFRISIKSPHVRPPKEPRRLLQMPTVELSDRNISDSNPFKGIATNPLRNIGIGIKLPGLQAGFPVLKKVQTEISETKQKEYDSTKQEAAEQKPKWMPPKNPGFGNPLMSELKNKLKKTTKE